MNSELVRQLLDACHDAREIGKLLPELPPKMRPRHIRIIRYIHVLNEEKGVVRISDVAHAMKGTMPSITKLVNELCDLGVVIKTRSTKDKRAYTLELTDRGEAYYEKYLDRFHGWLNSQLEDVPEEDVKRAVSVIRKLKEILEKGSEEL